MTNPAWYTPLEPAHGVYSPRGLSDHEKFFTELSKYTGFNLDATAQENSVTRTQSPSSIETQQQPPAMLPDATLVGRAMYWGVPEEQARMMPREALVALLEEKERGMNAPILMGGSVQSDLQQRAAISAMGAGMGILKHLPFIGEKIEKTELMQRADHWLGQFEEAAKMSKQQDGAFSLMQGGAKVAGTIGAFIIPGNAAWNLAGRLGKIIPGAAAITSPIVKIAAQSGASAWMLEGRGMDQTLLKFVNGTATQEDAEQLVRAGVTVGAGTGIGAALGGLIQYSPAIQELAGKVGKAFGGSWQKRVAPAGTTNASSLTDFEIPLDPNRVMNPLDEAARKAAQGEVAASQMTKQQILGESSIAPNIMRQALPDETMVAAAQTVDNPGGVNIVPGVADPAKFVAGMQNLGQRIAFARRPGSTALDAITSDEPVTQALIKQYEKNGLFTGQDVMSSEGMPSRIVAWGEEIVEIKPLYGGFARTVPRNSVMPLPSSSGVIESPPLWDYFQTYANQRAAASSQAVGGALTPDRLLQFKNENLPQYIGDFLDQAGITAKGQRARITAYFNTRFVDDFKALAPEENALQQSIGIQAAATSLVQPTSSLTTLEQKAAAKGFNIVLDGRTGKWLALDMNNLDTSATNAPKQISFDSQEAMEEWITRFHINRPDISPSSTVPLEVAEGIPTQGLYEPKVPFENELIGLQKESVLELADDLAEKNPGIADGLRLQVEEAAAQGNLGKVQAAWEYGLAQLQPMRARFLEIERNMAQVGGTISEIKPWTKIYDPVQTAQTKYHQEVSPWLERAAGIITKFNREDIRTGKVTQIWELIDPALRKGAAKAAGFTPRQVEALDEMEAYINELGGPGAARKVADYISRLRIRQSLPLDERAAFQMPDVDDLTRPFAEFAEGNSLQVRALDTSVLMNSMARSMMYRQHLAPAWEPASRAAGEIASTEGMKELGGFMQNWLHSVRFGYDPRPDQFLGFGHSVLSALIPGVTKAQTRKLFGFGMSTTHRALLGWQPHVLARDSMQLLLAVPRVGTDLLDTMRLFATSGEEGQAVRAMIRKRGEDGGWIVPGMPRIASPGALEDPLVYVADEVAPVAQQAQSRRYKALQRGVDVAYDFLPEGLRSPAGTKMDPLYLYTKQSEIMRSLPGYAMASRADKVIAQWRAAGQMDFDQLVKQSRASTFDASVQDKFKQYIAAGDDKGAADFLGRQTAHATQFLYGLTENPEVGRTVAGRMGMQMGNFTTQFYQYVRESLRNGTMGDKARFFATMGIVYGALKLGKAATGWDFDKWQFHHSLTFTGGPWTRPIADALSGAAGVGQMAWQEGGSQTGTGRYQEEQAGRLGNAMSDVFQFLNPAGGGMRTIQGIDQALQSPDPAEALGRLFTTGERGAAPDWKEEYSRVFGAPPPEMPTPQQMQPYQSPVRAGGFGVPQSSQLPRQP